MKKLNILKRRAFLTASLSFLVVAVIMAFGFYQCVLAAEVKPIVQKTFKSPEEAGKSLMDAVKSNDTKELLAIFGPAGKELISSGDEVADKAGRERFIQDYEEMNKLEKETDKKVTLVVGDREWPFPIPIVKKGETWVFDTMAGKEELLNRRIGRNELNTIQTCLAYVDAQREYAMKDRDNNKLLEYARKFWSTPGKKDGLYWETKEGEAESPFGAVAAQAVQEGYKPKNPGDKPSPYHGYYYKILKAQGKNAEGGAYDYVINGKMIGGFALVAYPAEHGASGVMTFIVNHDGVVYQKDLGKETGKIAKAMAKYDPDKTWKKVE
ncbi:MAG TPA: DUF2950 domain-containing protein [Thermodesulfobacteriota bacterium]|nr:DUF2950 domain-containing protein [Thermodesulfobacteriota bacterium]